ncbi:unnamed protein product [Chrysoparadoxa australica]
MLGIVNAITWVGSLCFFFALGNAFTLTCSANPLERVSRQKVLQQALTGCSVLLVAPSAAPAKALRVKNPELVTLPNGATYKDMAIGDGLSPTPGARVAIHLTLYCNGLELMSTRDSQGLAARPFGFDFGRGEEGGIGTFPKALEAAIETMKVGGRRKITLPPELAYGKEGQPPFIPPNTAVLFDISLLSVKASGSNVNISMPGSAVY